jgi:hypothetical protein
MKRELEGLQNQALQIVRQGSMVIANENLMV